MYVPLTLEPNEIGFIKVMQEFLDEPQSAQTPNATDPVGTQGTSLIAQGMSEDFEVIFDYENEKQQIS